MAAASADRNAAGTRRRWIEAGLVMGFWTLLALLMVGSEALDPRERLAGDLGWRKILRPFMRFYLWALITPLIFWLCRRLPLERPRLIRRAALHLGLMFVVSFVVDIFDDALRIVLLQPSEVWARAFNPLDDLVGLGFLYEITIYPAVLAAGFARDYFLRFEARQQEAARLHARTARLERQLAEARLEALRMQINPHFLFNTLHAISTLVGDDPAGVRRMITRLSELLRYVLRESSRQEVPLHQEMTFVEAYLDIMQIRFQGRLDVQLNAAVEAHEALVPNLLLQPLVENAVRHGASEREGRGEVEVRAERQGEQLVLRVRDNGPRFSPSGDGAAGGTPSFEEGTGLKNVRGRLDELYGSAAGLSFRTADAGGLVAIVTLPFYTSGDLRTSAAHEGDGARDLPRRAAEPAHAQTGP